MVAMVFTGKNKEVLERLHQALVDSTDKITGEQCTVDDYIRQNCTTLPQWAIVVEEWVGDGRGKMKKNLIHMTFTGEFEDLRPWLDNKCYNLLGWDGPF